MQRGMREMKRVLKIRDVPVLEELPPRPRVERERHPSLSLSLAKRRTQTRTD